MNRLAKITLTGAALVVLGAGALFAFKGDDIQRLATVNTLFDEDKIVDNFSNMDRAFLTRTLEVDRADDWVEDPQSLPETVDIAGTERPLADVLDELDTTALVIIRDGQLIHESYYRGTGPDDRRISWSVAKSFMSGLYGSALESGAIASLDDEITRYVPELAGTAYEGATLRNILNMSSGVRFNEDYMDQGSDINKMGRTIALGGSLDTYSTSLMDSAFEPGTDWQYVSMDTHVAAWALRRATGKSLHELWETTYGRLGFRQPPFYLTDGEGVAFALGGLNLTTRDYAKFGQLFLQEGMWNGQPLIPADWVAQSTVHSAPAISDRGVGYGYQWWVPMPAADDYFAVGIYGQYVYVDPKTNIIIAKNAADREFAFADEVGTHSMNKNIELFRSLARKLGAQAAVKKDLYNVSYCLVETTVALTPATIPENKSIDELIEPVVDRMVESATDVVFQNADMKLVDEAIASGQTELMSIFGDEVDWTTYGDEALVKTIEASYRDCIASRK